MPVLVGQMAVADLPVANSRQKGGLVLDLVENLSLAKSVDDLGRHLVAEFAQLLERRLVKVPPRALALCKQRLRRRRNIASRMQRRKREGEGTCNEMTEREV